MRSTRIAILVTIPVRGVSGIAQSDLTPLATRLLRAPRAWLAICVNETSQDAHRRLVVEGRPFDIPVLAGRTRLALIESGSARLIASTPGPEIALARVAKPGPAPH